MAITWPRNPDDLSPDRNDAAEEAKRELEYMDQQELLRKGQEDRATNINFAVVQPAMPTPMTTNRAPPRVVNDPPLTRSSTQPRRSSRLDTTNKTARVRFDNPRPVIKRANGHKVPTHPSPSFRGTELRLHQCPHLHLFLRLLQSHLLNHLLTK